MMITQDQFNGSIIALGLIFAVIIISYLIDKIFFYRILKITARRRLTNSRIIIRQIQGLFTSWLVIGMIYLDLYFISQGNLNVPLGDEILTWIEYVTRFLLVISIIYFINSLGQNFLQFYIRKGKLPSTTIFSNLTKIFIFFLAISIILASYGISIAPIVATLGVGGLAIALALQDTLSSLFAGVYILLSKQINPGDYVRLETGQEGFVQDINWRNTTIRTRENNIIIVPNKNLANFLIINFSLIQEDMSVIVPVGVHYDSDLDLVEQLVVEVGREVLQSVEGGVPDFEPLIRYSAFGDSAIMFNAVLRSKNYASQFLIRHEFIRRLRKKFAQNGITIPYPMRTLTWDNPNDRKINDTM